MCIFCFNTLSENPIFPDCTWLLRPNQCEWPFTQSGWGKHKNIQMPWFSSYHNNILKLASYLWMSSNPTDAPRGKSRDRPLATVHACSSTDWVSLKKLRTQPMNSRDGHLPKDVILMTWGYSSLICNLIATHFTAVTAAWWLLLKSWLPKQEISKNWSVVLVTPCFQSHVHVAYMLNEGVHTPMGQHQATLEPKSWHFGTSSWVKLCTCTWHQALKMTTKVSQFGANINGMYVCCSAQSRMKCYVINKV